MVNQDSQQQPEGKELSSSLHFINASEAGEYLTDASLEHLAEVLMEQTFHPVTDLNDDTQKRLQAVLSTLDRSKPLPKDHEMRATQEWRKYREGIVNHYREMASTKDLIVAVADGKIVGIAGCQGEGFQNGREVYEVVHAAVLPEYQGKVSFVSLAQGAMECISHHSENGLLLVHTRHPKIIQILQRRGATEISPAEHVAITHAAYPETAAKALDRRTLKANEGMKAFLMPVRPEAQ